MAKKCNRGYSSQKGKCEKNKVFFGRKNSINQNSMWSFVLVFGVLLMVGVLFYGGGQGWFKSLTVIENVDLVGYLDTPNHELDYSCSLSFLPNLIYVGDSTTGTILDGKNSLCRVFVNDGIQWLKVYEGYTDENGAISNIQTINTVGTFTFRAICDLNNNNRVDVDDCLTNPEELIVLPRDTCSDTDGKDRMTAGHVTSELGIFYDECVGDDSVTEFWCDGNVVTGTLLSCGEGYECISTRSGGYCQASTPTYSDGDLIGTYNGGGSGTESAYEFEIDLGDLGYGNCELQATISTSWNYDFGECEGLQGMEGVRWDFYDSLGLKYTRIDTSPISLGVVTDCGLVYDRQTPFRLTMSKIMGLPDCGLSYEWEVRILTCNCAD